MTNSTAPAPPTQSSSPQHLLTIAYYVPYVSIGATALSLCFSAFVLETSNSLSGVAGGSMLMLLTLHLLQVSQKRTHNDNNNHWLAKRLAMDNHTLKNDCFWIQTIYMATCVGYWVLDMLNQRTDTNPLAEFQIFKTIWLYWLPRWLYSLFVMEIPSAARLGDPQTFPIMLGNASSTMFPDMLQKYGVTHVLELHEPGLQRTKAEKLQAVGIHVLQIRCSGDVDDTSQAFLEVVPQALECLERALTKEKNNASNLVLVQCDTCVTRSPALVVLWLVLSGRCQDMAEAEALIRQARPVADIGGPHRAAIQEYLRRM